MRVSVAHSDKELPACDNWYQSMVETTLLGFLLPFTQITIMSKKMTSPECFDAINVALRNLKGVADVIRNIQNVEIPKLFQRA